MLETMQRQIRDDCRASLAAVPGLVAQMAGQRVAVVGGTGFSGTWLAEMVALMNDEFGSGLRLDLLGRSAGKWTERHPHLVREDVVLHAVDARSPFELPRDTTLVLYAAGIADPRVLASEPQRVFQTNVYGLDNALSAAVRLEGIQRFVNVSSGLVAGSGVPPHALKESDLGLLDFTRFHNLYAEARRAAESLACGFAGQYRLPVTTVRAFTFLGPYQDVDTPWAVNNFVRDAIDGHEIRIHGDGSVSRSYLYGSDVAAWLLRACAAGKDGAVYNFGGDTAVSHAQAAAWVAERTNPSPQLVYKSQPREDRRNHDFYPDLSHTTRELGVRAVIDAATAIERTMRWHAHESGALRRLRNLA
jgi:nucleoside-diphosphate-sugar epimerase